MTAASASLGLANNGRESVGGKEIDFASAGNFASRSRLVLDNCVGSATVSPMQLP